MESNRWKPHYSWNYYRLDSDTVMNWEQEYKELRKKYLKLLVLLAEKLADDDELKELIDKELKCASPKKSPNHLPH